MLLVVPLFGILVTLSDGSPLRSNRHGWRMSAARGQSCDDLPSRGWTPLLSSCGSWKVFDDEDETGFTLEFKREAVALLESSGRPLMQSAAELGISPSMLRNWRAVVNGAAPRSKAGSRAPAPSTSPITSPADQAAEIARLRRELDRTRGRCFLGGDRPLRGDAQMRFGFIEQHARAYPVRLMCRVLQVSPSGYDAWRSRPASPRASANRGLLQEGHRLHGQHQGRSGSPRMHAALRAQGHRVSRGRVERLMRRHGIRALARRRFRPRPTTVISCRLRPPCCSRSSLSSSRTGRAENELTRCPRKQRKISSLVPYRIGREGGTDEFCIAATLELYRSRW